jgi:hypothetical protein
MTLEEVYEEFGVNYGFRPDGQVVTWYANLGRDDCHALVWADVAFIATGRIPVTLADILAPALTPLEVANLEGYPTLEAWFADVTPIR